MGTEDEDPFNRPLRTPLRVDRSGPPRASTRTRAPGQRPPQPSPQGNHTTSTRSSGTRNTATNNERASNGTQTMVRVPPPSNFPSARESLIESSDDENEAGSFVASPPSLHRNQARVTSAGNFPGAVQVSGGMSRQISEQTSGNRGYFQDDDTFDLAQHSEDVIHEEVLLSSQRHQIRERESSMDSAPSIVAELVPDEDDVSARVAQRVEAQLAERLKQEVEARLALHEQMRRQQPDAALAAITSTSPIVTTAEIISVDDPASSSYSNAASDNNKKEDDDNFYICGLPRRKWGLILVVLGLAVAGAVAGMSLSHKSQKRESSLAPTTPTPTASPTLDTVWDELWDTIGEKIQQNDENEDENPWFNPSSPQYTAFSWMAVDDPFTRTVLNSQTSSSTIDVLVERYSLVVLYFALNGPDWREQGNFLAPTDVCNWNIGGSIYDSLENISGVYCTEGEDATSIVTHLYFGYNNLGGRLPWELSLLTDLVLVWFQGNDILGTIPLELSRLENLEDFWFGQNALSGFLPTSMSSMTTLRSVDLQGNRLVGTLPGDWGPSLINLEYLDLKLNAFDGSFPVSWQGLFRLRTLDLEGNFLSGSIPTQLGVLTDLNQLYLENNAFEGTLPDELGRLTGLMYFGIQENRLTGTVPTSFLNLNNLEYFSFHGNQLTGTVDDTLCINPFVIRNFIADCCGDPPEIECSCCSKCYTANGRECF